MSVNAILLTVLTALVLLATALRTAWASVSPEVIAKWPRIGHTLDAASLVVRIIGQLAAQLLTALHGLATGAPWPVVQAASKPPGAARRSVLTTLCLLPVAFLLAQCSAPQGGGGDGGPSFVAVAGAILANLDSLLASLQGTLPVGVPSGVLLAIAEARQTIRVCQDALTAYQRTSSGSLCGQLGADIASAVDAALAVVQALQAAGIAIATPVLVAIEAVGTIADQVAAAVCPVPSRDGGIVAGVEALSRAQTPALHNRFAALHLAWQPVPASLRCVPVSQ